ncbi:MAG: hypothetical protein ACJAZ3_001272 [Sphingobacteriales bacterium]|jgi:hypothetical protein
MFLTKRQFVIKMLKKWVKNSKFDTYLCTSKYLIVMTKKLFQSTILILFLAISINSYSQPLIGTYIISNNPADVNVNYATIEAAVADVSSKGVSGPVIFNIKLGVYIERITIGYIPGISAANRVVFQSASGNPQDVTLTPPKDNNYDPNKTLKEQIADVQKKTMNNHYVLRLDAAQYVSIKNISINNSGLVFQTGLHICKLTRFIIIDGCNISIGPPISTGAEATSGVESAAILIANKDETNINDFTIFQPGNNAQDLTLINNTLSGGQFSVFWDQFGQYTYNNLVQGNIFQTPENRALAMGSIWNSKIKGNIIHTTVESQGGAQGIAIELVSCRNTTVEGNSIQGSFLNAIRLGLYNVNCNIFNNMISKSGVAPRSVDPPEEVLGSGKYWVHSGIFINGSSSINIANNTVLHTNNATPVEGGEGEDLTPYNVYILGGSGIRIINNNLVNTAEGILIAIHSSGYVTQCDYNNLKTNGLYITKVNNVGYVNLADYKTFTSYGDKSLVVDPEFLSNNDLHTFKSELNAKAIKLPYVTEDFDGEPRDETAPDIGADEFIVDLFDLAVTDISTIKTGNLLEIALEMTNNGRSSLIDSQVQFQYSVDNGSMWTTAQNHTITSLLNTYDTENFTFTLKHDVLEKENKLCVRLVNSSLPSDTVFSNNVFCKTICTTTAYKKEVKSVNNATNICSGSAIKFYVEDNTKSVYWLKSTDSINYSAAQNPTNDTLVLNPTTKVFVKALISSGSCGFDTSLVAKAEVFSDPELEISIATLNNLICAGSEAVVYLDGVPLDATREWYTIDQNDNYTVISGQIQDTLKYVISQDQEFGAVITYGQCQTELVKSITINTNSEPTPDVTISNQKDTVCIGEETSISLANLPTSYSIIWEQSIDELEYNEIQDSTNNILNVEVSENTFYRATIIYGDCMQSIQVETEIKTNSEIAPNGLIVAENETVCGEEKVKVYLAQQTELDFAWYYSTDSIEFELLPSQTTDSVKGYFSGVNYFKAIISAGICSDELETNVIETNHFFRPVGSFSYFDSVLTHQDLEFVNSSVYADSLIWLVNGDPASTDTNLVYSFTDTGLVEISLLLISTNCGTDTTSYFMYVSENPNPPASVENLVFDKDIELYPNPTSGVVQLNLNGQNIKSVKVYSVLGKLMTESTTKTNGYELNLSRVNSGVYFVKITGFNNETLTKRVVKL